MRLCLCVSVKCVSAMCVFVLCVRVPCVGGMQKPMQTELRKFPPCAARSLPVARVFTTLSRFPLHPPLQSTPGGLPGEVARMTHPHKPVGIEAGTILNKSPEELDARAAAIAGDCE